jgi:hypothetical protein
VVWADDGNILGKNRNTIKKKTKDLLEASENVGLIVKAEKTVYKVMSHHQNALLNDC